MRKLIIIISVVLLSIIVIVAAGFGIMYGVNAYNEKHIDDYESVLDGIEDVDPLETFTISESDFNNCLIGKTADYYSKTSDESELYHGYYAVIKYKGKKLECKAEQCIYKDGEEQKNPDFQVEVYQNCKVVPKIYAVGEKLYGSFESGKLDSDLSLLFTFGTDGSSVYQYDDTFYHFIVDPLTFKDKTYESSFVMSKLPVEYIKDVTKALDEKGIDVSGYDINE